MSYLSLIPHPASPGSAVRAINVMAARPARDQIVLRYWIEGDLDAIRWPNYSGPAFAHELWMHTCCEAFIAGEGDFYRELNLSPSLQYAIYDFNGYRGQMRASEERTISIHWSQYLGVLSAIVTMPALADTEEWRLGLSCVIEEASGAKSFWALAHAPGPPDFHNPACFTATLPAPPAP